MECEICKAEHRPPEGKPWVGGPLGEIIHLATGPACRLCLKHRREWDEYCIHTDAWEARQQAEARWKVGCVVYHGHGNNGFVPMDGIANALLSAEEALAEVARQWLKRKLAPAAGEPADEATHTSAEKPEN